MTFRIATWNINSVRLRIGLVKKLAEEAMPDLICLQETKVEDAHFPLDALASLGYPHIVFSGQKSYNGVAILSKVPLAEKNCMGLAGLDHKRHICARLQNGVALHNFYVPAGGDIPDPVANPAYGFKLRFVEEMTDWSNRAQTAKDKVIVLGDFNIAPGEHDVWSSRQLRHVVSHTEPERTRLDALLQSQNWCDAARHFVPSADKLYSWWSYRNRDWRKSDRGRRLDHVWVSPPLKSALRSFEILKDARDWQAGEAGPSDHVPVVLDLDLPSA